MHTSIAKSELALGLPHKIMIARLHLDGSLNKKEKKEKN
jgi:hypothetical protein